MKIDLCKLLGVEEGEEFKLKLFGVIEKYRFKNGKLEYYDDVINKWVKSRITMNHFLNSEIIKLLKKKEFTEDELYILKNVNKKYKWIAKDSDGEVWTYSDKPKKRNVYWTGYPPFKPLDFEPLDIIKNSLFTEIQWEDEEPIYIDDYVER